MLKCYREFKLPVAFLLKKKLQLFNILHNEKNYFDGGRNGKFNDDGADYRGYRK